eukprot:198776-Prorocentrum_minimum.AAC.1
MARSAARSTARPAGRAAARTAAQMAWTVDQRVGTLYPARAARTSHPATVPRPHPHQRTPTCSS